MRPLFVLSFTVACGLKPAPSGDGDPVCSDAFYADIDGDGHGDLRSSITECTAPDGYVASSDDCDDSDPAVHPGADEICDGVDGDCNGTIDVDAIDAVVWYADADADGFGDGGDATERCSKPAGYTEMGGDCDDSDADVNPAAVETCNGVDDDCDALYDAEDPSIVEAPLWHLDTDADGYGDATGVVACSEPAGAIADDSDCDDTSADVHPGADEVCDGLDNDCDGLLDDADDDVSGLQRFYVDADGDGIGIGPATSAVEACTAPKGYAAERHDCDDTDASVGGWEEAHPDYDGDGYGYKNSAYVGCSPPVDWITDGTDCDDMDDEIHPAATEVCNDGDDNCDGLVDDDDPLVVATDLYADADGDGFGDPSVTTPGCDAFPGYAASNRDCDDGNPDISPAAPEYCDGIDNDCDGTEDDAVVYVDWYVDDDGDGFGDATDALNACSQPSGFVLQAGDCDDGVAATNPGAEDVCGNGVDDDCEGVVDNCTLSVDQSEFVLWGASDWSVGDRIGATDLNGDGTADLAASGQYADLEHGQVFVVFGPATGAMTTDAADVVFTTTRPGAYLGSAIDGSDLDGDGGGDLAIGAAGINSVYLFLGPVTADADITAADAALTSGPGPNDTGSAVLVVADHDGDGARDVVVGAPHWDNFADGRVYVASGAWTADVDLDAGSVYVYDGDSYGDDLGASIADLGDVNGDGLEDLALGAPKDGDGAIYVIEGGAAPGYYFLPDAAAATLAPADLPSRDYFGLDTEPADYDGDGYTDLFVGAPWADNVQGDRTGVVYGLLGPFSGAVVPHDASVRWEGFSSDTSDVINVGYSIEAGGDVDGDGEPDVLFNATQISGADWQGALYLQVGNAEGVVGVSDLILVTAGLPYRLGTDMAFFPDWSGDGRPEIAFGSTGTPDATGANVGSVSMLFSENLR